MQLFHGALVSFAERRVIYMRKSRIIAALLAGTMLCNSIPLSTWAFNQDNVSDVFGDGENEVSAEDATNLPEVEADLTEADTAEESSKESDVFTDDSAETDFVDGTMDDFTDSVEIELGKAISGESTISSVLWNGHYYKVYDSSMDWESAKNTVKNREVTLLRLQVKKSNQLSVLL